MRSVYNIKYITKKKADWILFIYKSKYYNDIHIFDATYLLIILKVFDFLLSNNSFRRTIANITFPVKYSVVVKKYISFNQKAIVIYDKDYSDNKNNNKNKNKNQYQVFD